MADTNQGNGGTKSHVDEVLRHGKTIKSETSELTRELNIVVSQAQEKIRERMETHPYQTIAIAAGVGYVLGGGLFSRFTGRLVKLGIRVAVVPMLKNQLAALGEAASQGAAGLSGETGFQQGYAGVDLGKKGTI